MTWFFVRVDWLLGLIGCSGGLDWLVGLPY